MQLACPATTSNEPPWSDAIGKGLWTAWSLTNHRRYPDAIQLEFNVSAEEIDLGVQLFGKALKAALA